MADAYVIETAGETAGIVVREKRGVRFFAAEAAFYPLDGKTFDSVNAAHRAVGDLRRGRAGRSQRGALRTAA